MIAHPKVKVFITHGGLLGTQESLYHSTPMIVLPIYGDQPRNCQTIKEKQFGLCIEWQSLSINVISQAINEVITNPM